MVLCYNIYMEDKYKRAKTIVYKNQFHIIFCPKYRRKVLKDGIDIRLKEILYEIAKEQNIDIKALEVMPDHVHMFIEFDPRKSLHKVIKDFKGISSRILRNEFPALKSKLPTLWTRSYFSSTVGNITESTIKKYIEDQKGK